MLFLMIWARYAERLTFVIDQSDLSIQKQIPSKSARILHLDEILTMSAMMAASTGDKAWIARYNRFVPELDRLIKETARLAASKKANKQLAKTDKSNQNLIRIETASFRLVLAGKRQEAWALLTGSEYLLQKAIYSRGIKDFLREIDSEEKIHTSEAMGNSYRQFLEKIVLNCLVLTLWFMALWKISLVWKRKPGNLREKEELLSCTLHSIGDGVITTDCDGKVTRLNPIAETLTGWTMTDAVDRPITEVFHIINTLTGELAVNPMTQVLATGENAEFPYGTIIVSKDGLERQIADSCSPVRNNQGRIIGVVLVFRDVTEEYRQRQRLHDSEDRFRTLFESSRDAMMTLEPPSWKFTSCNQAAVSMFRTKDSNGFTALGPWNVSPEWQPDGNSSADKSQKAIETAMNEGSCFFEWTHMRVGGEEFPATVLLTRMEQGGKTFLQATVRDITEQKQSEEALRREKDNLAAVFAASPIGMFLLDEETMIVDANSVIASMVSRKPKEIINQRGGGGLGCIHSLENDKGCGFSDVCPDCSLRQGIEQVLSDGTSIHGSEIQTTLLIDGQEQYLWLRISAEPVILDACKHIVVAIDDITERK
ncbi:MAG: PAS domain-containing protein [Armatimonadota bacterium]